MASGLIDSDTGLAFGDGLIWMNDGIGGAGLDVDTGVVPPVDDPSLDFSQAQNSMYIPILRFSIVGLLGFLALSAFNLGG